MPGQGMVDSIQASAENPSLSRDIELFLVRHGLKPFSPIKDRIGSQATKGMRYARTGVLRTRASHHPNGAVLTAIESYPAARKPSAPLRVLLQSYSSRSESTQADDWDTTGFGYGIKYKDKRDALLCALIVWLYCYQPEELCPPEVEPPAGEGWIYVPSDALAASDQ